MTIAELLRLAALGRAHYAACCPEGSIARYRLEAEAATWQQAAQLAEGDRTVLYGALPSFMWDQAGLPPVNPPHLLGAPPNGAEAA
jgi:hypothetical protein